MTTRYFRNTSTFETIGSLVYTVNKLLTDAH